MSFIPQHITYVISCGREHLRSSPRAPQLLVFMPFIASPRVWAGPRDWLLMDRLAKVM